MLILNFGSGIRIRISVVFGTDYQISGIGTSVVHEQNE